MGDYRAAVRLPFMQARKLATASDVPQVQGATRSALHRGLTVRLIDGAPPASIHHPSYANVRRQIEIEGDT